MADSRSFFLKVKIEELERAKADLKSIGDAGASSFKLMERAGADAAKRLTEISSGAGAARISTGNLATGLGALGKQAATGELSFEGLKSSVIGFAGAMGGPLGSIALVAGLTAAIFLVTKAVQGFAQGTQHLKEEQDELNKSLASGKLKAEEAKVSAEQNAKAYEAETKNLRELNEQRVRQAEAALIALEAEVQIRQAMTSPGLNPEDDVVVQTMRRRIDEMRAAITVFRAGRGEFRDGARGDPRNVITQSMIDDANAARKKAGEDAVAAEKKRIEETVKLEREAEKALALDKRALIEIEAAHELEEQEAKLAAGEIKLEEYLRREESIREKTRGRIAEAEREAAKKIAEELEKAHEAAAKKAQQIWEKFGDGLGDILADALVNGFKFDRAQIEREIFGLAGGLAKSQFIHPLLSGVGLRTPSASDAASPLFNLGRSFSGGGTLFGQPLFPESAVDAAARTGDPVNASASPGLLQSGVAGGATGFGIGSILSSIFPGTFNSTGSQIGGSVGGIAGSIIGSIIPGVGTVIGSVAGSLLGSIFGGLFGNKKPSGGPAGSAAIEFDRPNKRAIVGNIGVDNGGDPVASRQFGQAMADAINRLSEAIGVPLNNQGIGIVGLGGGGFNAQATGVYASGSDAQAVIESALFQVLKRGNVRGAAFIEMGELMAKAIANSTATDLEGLLGDIEFAKGIEDIVEGLESAGHALAEVERLAKIAAREQLKSVTEVVERARGLGFADEAERARVALVEQLLDVTAKPEQITETAKALAALAANFAVVRENAEALGITEARIAEAEAAAKNELRKGFDEGIAQQILAIVDPLAAALEQFDEAARLRLEEARAAGADLVEVERLSGLQRQQVIDQIAGASISSLQRFYEEITFGGLSGASPLGSLEGVRASFQAAAAQGDRGRLEDLGRQLLTQSRSAFASGAGFQTDLDLVRNVVGPLVQSNDNAVVAAINASGGEQARLTFQLVQRVDQLLLVQQEQADEIGRLSAHLQRLLAA